MAGNRFFLKGPRHWLKRSAEWMIDLVIVFVGVYAAFLLNGFESRREQSTRREQLLEWLDDYCSELAANLQNEQTSIEQAVTDFNRRLNNGEMPELVYINKRSVRCPAGQMASPPLLPSLPSVQVSFAYFCPG